MNKEVRKCLLVSPKNKKKILRMKGYVFSLGVLTHTVAVPIIQYI